MRYLVSIQPDYEKLNALDRSRDILAFLDWLRDTFAVETMFLEAARRKIWLVVNFETGGELNKLTCVSLFRLGVAPTFREIFTEAENRTAIPISLAFMESEAPGSPPED